MAISARQAIAIQRSQVATFNLWYGSVRSGKTVASLWAFLHRVVEHEGDGIILIVGLNRNTVWRNIFVPLLSSAQFKSVAEHIRYREGAPSGIVFGKRVQVVGANDESSWLAIQGLTVAICLGDEVTGWPESFWDMLETRLSLSTSWFLGTCNPGAANHYLVSRVIERANNGDPDYHIERMLLHHNPFVPEKVKARYHRTLSGVFARRMLWGEWIAAEGAVFADWDPSQMVVEDLPPIVATLGLGIDYGTTNPTRGVMLGLGDDGILYAMRGWSPQSGTDAALSADLRRWLQDGPQPEWVYVDPAAASFKLQLADDGVPGVLNATNNVIDGIRTVASLLTWGRLKIHADCEQLIIELPGYRWDPKATEKGRDAPIKEDDHAIDALRYAVSSSRWVWSRAVEHYDKKE